jgi:drug/metabolite transporter (DMT)-like permease
MATVGLALLSLNDNLTIGYGDLLTVGCAVAFAFHIVYINKYGPQIEPVVMVAVQLGVSAVAAFAMSALTETMMPLTTDVLLGAVYLGVMATAVAFSIQVYAQRMTTATRSALIYTMEPVFAASFAYLAVGEVIGPRGLVGCALILGGMLVAELL